MFYIGLIVVFLSVILGFMLEGGNIHILIQPYAALIILGSATGIFVTSNSKEILYSVVSGFGKINNRIPYQKDDYLVLMVFLLYFFRYSKSRGWIEIEKEIEAPYKSNIFKEFPKFLARRTAVFFFCDYMRLFTLGFEKSYEIEQLIDERINVKKAHVRDVSSALYRLADALPALGIMAAVLGVINAMASINADAAVIGHKIGSALMGTFLGVAASYCLIHPFAAFLEKYMMDEIKYLETIKAGFVSFARGNSPIVSVEFARQIVPVELQPTFGEVEKAIERFKINKKVVKNARREQPAAA